MNDDHHHVILEKKRQVTEVLFDCLQRRAAGESLSDSIVVDQHPELMPELGEKLNLLQAVNRAFKQADRETPGHANAADETPFSRFLCPECSHEIEPSDTLEDNACCTHCGQHFNLRRGIETVPGDFRTILQDRFELLDPIGQGAFGTVWRAHDAKLERDVAVKLPRYKFVSPGDMAQFESEAQSAAQLKHPNIVTVHELIRDEDSICIVSELIEGTTLADWIESGNRLPVEVVRLCIAIARALASAHQQGVIHRDLKPSNILLDRDLQPHISDFGLAKREVADVTITINGQVLGTPAYMSPEQALGESHTADARSDVYSLGVILFELLTGQQPFRGSPQLLIQQVISQAPPRLRSLSSRVPVDLETICLKCLEKSPQRRYASAGDLADDLQRWLDRKPIVARPVGRIGWAVRWCQRRPLVAGLSAAVVISMIIGLTGVIWQWRIAQTNYEQSQANLGVAKSESQRANENLLQARQAVIDFMVKISDSDALVSTPHTYQLRTKLLEQAREYFEAFLKNNEDNSELAIDLAITRANLGSLYAELGHVADAESILLQAIGSLENSAANDRRSATELLAGRLKLGQTYLKLGRIGPARLEFEKVAKSGQAHPQQDDKSIACVAFANNNLGKISLDLGKLQECREYFRRAVDILSAHGDRLAHAIPSLVRNRAIVHTNLGYVLTRLGDNVGATRQFEIGFELFGQLETEGALGAISLANIAMAKCHRAKLYLAMGDSLRALTEIEDSQELLDKLSNEHPDLSELPLLVGRTLDENAKLMSQLGKYDAAVLLFERAVDELQTRRVPGEGDFFYERALSTARRNLALQLSLNGDFDRAEQQILLATQQISSLADRNPETVEVSFEFAKALGQQAEIYQLNGKPLSSIESGNRATQIFSELHERDPENLEALIALIESHTALVNSSLRRGDIAAALSQAGGAAEIAEAVSGKDFKSRIARASALECLGNANLLGGKHEAAIAPLESAIAAYESILNERPKWTRMKTALSGSQVNLAAVFRNLNRLDEAIELASFAHQTLLEVISTNPSDFSAKQFLAIGKTELATSLHARARQWLDENPTKTGSLPDLSNDALKACEISEWRQWRFVETLADVYQRKGDHKSQLAKLTLAIKLAPGPEQRRLKTKLESAQTEK